MSLVYLAFMMVATIEGVAMLGYHLTDRVEGVTVPLASVDASAEFTIFL